ncbi:hypothetical protein E3N88_12639 [Mikania micrantha]|uniref:Uncharacterized protein n=1 Tax=Mikania micrantha TaxID=192012 RepID=A0A5N6P6A3_9ASTR|nr:hypothetical protein E3N88_12639 [Mikania micrantha]
MEQRNIRTDAQHLAQQDQSSSNAELNKEKPKREIKIPAQRLSQLQTLLVPMIFHLPSPSTYSLTLAPTKPTSTPALLRTPSTSPINLPFTRLSAEALQQRRKDGLCFKCPENFFPCHKCSPPQFLLIFDNHDQDDMLSDQSSTPQTNVCKKLTTVK